jgi:S-adenosylmethionine hydrolase
MPLPRLEVSDGRIRGEVLSIDHFGNIITSIGRLEWAHEGELLLHHAFDRSQPIARLNVDKCEVRYEDWRIDSLAVTYADVARGSLLALVGSSGFLEIAINQGNACAQLGADVGFEFDLIIG